MRLCQTKEEKMTTLSPIILLRFHFFLLLIIFFFFSFKVINGNNTTQQSNLNLIEQTCKTCAKTDPNINYTFCTTSLQAAPAGQCAATLRGLGSVSIALVFNNVTDTRLYIKGLMRQRKFEPYVRECLGDCFELYLDAIPNVEEAMENCRRMQYDEANVKISAVMDAATTCDDGFKERKGGGEVVSPLTKRNEDVFQLSAVALSVMHQIQTEPPPTD